MSQDADKPDYQELASQYDEEAKAYDSYGYDVIFGMSF